MSISRVFLILLIPTVFFGQEKIIQDFNMDRVQDTMYFKCNRSLEIEGQPFCETQIRIGKSKKIYMFKIYYVNSPIVDTCGEGCISVFNDADDTEYYQEFKYSKKYDDWILTKDEELLKFENDKTVNKMQKKYLLGISGRKYLTLKKK